MTNAYRLSRKDFARFLEHDAHRWPTTTPEVYPET